MADIFATEDARNLLHNKSVLLLGSSNMRATYKDLILLLSRNEVANLDLLRCRGETSFEGDKRVVFSGLIRGRQYQERRIFEKFDTHFEYRFIARCYTPEIETLFREMKNGQTKVPDVIIMNSCLWDISRWGPNGVDTYKENMQKLMLLLKECLPQETLFIWTTALPVSSEIRGGLLIKQLHFMQDLLRFDVMEANLFCRQLIVSHGYDVLDIHYHLRMQVHRRLPDGIHYSPFAVRFVTNLILTHISLTWNIPLPGNVNGVALQRVITHGILPKNGNVELSELPESPCDVNSNSESSKQPASPCNVNGNAELSELPASPCDVNDNTELTKLPVSPCNVNGNAELSTLPAAFCDVKESKEKQRTTPKKNGIFKRNPFRGRARQRRRPLQRREQPTAQGWQNDDVWTGNSCGTSIQQKPPPLLRFSQTNSSNDHWNDLTYASQRECGRGNHMNFGRAPGPFRKLSQFSNGRRRLY